MFYSGSERLLKNLLFQILEPLDYWRIKLWGILYLVLYGQFLHLDFDSILFLTWNAAKEMYSSIIQGYEK